MTAPRLTYQAGEIGWSPFEPLGTSYLAFQTYAQIARAINDYRRKFIGHDETDFTFLADGDYDLEIPEAGSPHYARDMAKTCLEEFQTSIGWSASHNYTDSDGVSWVWVKNAECDPLDWTTPSFTEIESVMDFYQAICGTYALRATVDHMWGKHAIAYGGSNDIAIAASSTQRTKAWLHDYDYAWPGWGVDGPWSGDPVYEPGGWWLSLGAGCGYMVDIDIPFSDYFIQAARKRINWRLGNTWGDFETPVILTVNAGFSRNNDYPEHTSSSGYLAPGGTLSVGTLTAAQATDATIGAGPSDIWTWSGTHLDPFQQSFEINLPPSDDLYISIECNIGDTGETDLEEETSFISGGYLYIQFYSALSSVNDDPPYGVGTKLGWQEEDAA